MAGKPAYVEFQPATQVKDDDPENTILLLHIPGFLKEQIRITYVHSSRTIRVEGEQPVDKSAKWRRFNQMFPVPQDCNVDKIHARFNNGLLTLTLPKQPPNPTPPAATITPPSYAPPPAPPSTHQQEQTAVKKPDHQPRMQEAAGASASASAPLGLRDNNYYKEKAKQEEGTAAPAAGNDQAHKESLVQNDKDTKEKLLHSDHVHAGGASDNQNKNNKPVEEDEKHSNKADKESSQPYRKLPAVGTGNGRPPRDHVKEMAATAVDKVRKGLTLEAGKEDRQLLLNVGVAVLVIVAVGAYVTYKIRSKSKHDI